MRSMLIVLALVAAACNSSIERADDAVTPAPTEVVGAGFAEPTPTQRPSGAFVVTLVDQNDNHPSGIPVDVTGAETRRVFSDADGKISFTTPGRYSITVVEGCHEAVQVLGGGYADIGVAAGSTKEAELVVQWRHRYGPAPPISMSSTAWTVGTVVELRFRVLDRCDDGTAPNANFPTFAPVLSDTLELAEVAGTRSNADGEGKIKVVCRSAGDTSVVLRDTANPTDELDLLRESISFGPPPRCSA